jgi:hypothetical protein
VLSYEAVAELRKSGFNAFRLEDGYPDWKAAGLPTEGVRQFLIGWRKDKFGFMLLAK